MSFSLRLNSSTHSNLYFHFKCVSCRNADVIKGNGTKNFFPQIDFESCKFHWHLFFFHVFVLPRASPIHVGLLQQSVQASAVYSVSIEPLKVRNVQKGLGPFTSPLFKLWDYLENVQRSPILIQKSYHRWYFPSKWCSSLLIYIPRWQNPIILQCLKYLVFRQV